MQNRQPAVNRLLCLKSVAERGVFAPPPALGAVRSLLGVSANLSAWPKRHDRHCVSMMMAFKIRYIKGESLLPVMSVSGVVKEKPELNARHIRQ